MRKTISEIAENILDQARKAGAEAADVLVVDGKTVSLEVRAGALEHAERSEGVDLGLRVLMGQRQACVSISDPSEDAIAQMAERAVAMAKLAPQDPFCGLADADQLVDQFDADGLEIYDAASENDEATYLELAKQAEAGALAVNGVDQVQSASSGFSKTEIYLAASNGFRGGYQRTNSSISTVAIAGTGAEMERDWCGEARSFFDDLPDADWIGTQAGQRAVSRFGATRPPTGAYPVLFDERISSSLIGHLLSAINGAMIQRGSSWAKDLLGLQVLPKGLDLLEDPTRKRMAGSKPFDAEGLAPQKRKLVADGVLMGWTLDLATGRALDMASTGNAGRGVGSPPSPGSGNIDLTQTTQSRADLISQMGTGLIVTSMIGATINPNTGDYSRGAAGLWVENGQITGPVNECTIAGNLVDMLAGIIPANDARGHLSRRVPSLLVQGMTIAGS